ncbi:RGS domain-containing protein [Blakeslea trispora]|nr:RGS domain-containing protein [Blakeslea trispora]
MSADLSVLSLESVLDDRNSDLFKEFSEYLHQSYCIENLSFWIAVQDYTKGHQKELCKSIIDLHIRPNSPQEINIPCEMRETILDLYNHEKHHCHLFDEAAEAILELMRVNSFLPWTTSSHLISSSSSTSTASSSSLENRRSWSIKKEKVLHSISTHTLSDAKWLVKLRQSTSSNTSSCPSSIESYECPCIDDINKASVSSVTRSGSRYRSMLKRVKQSFSFNFQSENKASHSNTSESCWRKTQR